MAASVNVYVPEELKGRLDKARLNLSHIAREAWERVLGLAELDSNEIRVDVRDDTGDIVELRFHGHLIVRSGYDGTEVYLIKGEFEGAPDAVVVIDDEGKWSTTPLADVEEEDIANLFRHDEEAYEGACKILGLKRVIRL